MLCKNKGRLSFVMGILLSCFLLSTPSVALQPIMIFTGGAVSDFGQAMQALIFANTTFEYKPQSAFHPIFGVLIGAEYHFATRWIWQFGLSFYNVPGSVDGVESQTPISNPTAVNLWNYHYHVASYQFFIDNKISITTHKKYHPYFLIGLGTAINDAHSFQVTAQNSGEVATAIFANHINTSFIYALGFGLDVNVSKRTRMGVGYRAAYLGETDFGRGTLDTGAGGSVFSLPVLQSSYVFNHELLIQLTYFI